MRVIKAMMKNKSEDKELDRILSRTGLSPLSKEEVEPEEESRRRKIKRRRMKRRRWKIKRRRRMRKRLKNGGG